MKKLFLMLTIVCSMMLTSCNWFGGNTDNEVEALPVDSTEMIIDSIDEIVEDTTCLEMVDSLEVVDEVVE